MYNFIIDTHSHFFDEAFDEDRFLAVERAIENNVEKIIIPLCDYSSIELTKELINKYPKNLFVAVGLHPENVHQDYKMEIAKILDFNFGKPNVAIGEIGLDLHYGSENFNLQKEVFVYQLELAIEKNLPVIIHCREAFDEMFQILKNYPKGQIKGVLHCFSGNAFDAQKILEISDLHFGIGGIITFKNSGKELCQIIQEIIPKEKLLLETDSPYITPVPFRGKRNESAYINYTAQKLAEILQISLEETINITTQNAINLFGI